MGAGEEEKHDQNMLYQVFFSIKKKNVSKIRARKKLVE